MLERFSVSKGMGGFDGAWILDFVISYHVCSRRNGFNYFEVKVMFNWLLVQF